jgi:hypothetical protein
VSHGSGGNSALSPPLVRLSELSPDFEEGGLTLIELKDIAYVRSGAADLPAAVRFATDIVGLELVASDEQGVAHLRADARHHCLALVAGRSGVIASGFTVADDGALRPKSCRNPSATSRSGTSSA